MILDPLLERSGNPMRKIVFRIGLLFAVSSAVASMTATVAEGQGSRSTHSRAVVALVEQLPAPAMASDIALVRRQGPGKPDLILLPRAKASGESLASAAFLLIVARERQAAGAGPSKAYDVRVATPRVPAAWRTGNLVRAQKWALRLLQAPARPLPGIGRVPALDVPLRSSARN